MTRPQDLNGGQSSNATTRAQPEIAGSKHHQKIVAIGRLRKQIAQRFQIAEELELTGGISFL